MMNPLRLEDLKVGDGVRIKLRHWPAPILSVVEGFEDIHDQLHGDLIGKGVKLRKVKASGRRSHMYSLTIGRDDPEILQRTEVPLPKKAPAPTCPYCNHLAELTNSAEVYGGRDFGKMVWRCRRCEAWVGCHPGTNTPLGRLANAELRKAKIAAHDAFDSLWRRKHVKEGGSKGRARGAGYRWLAEQLGIEPASCHIGMFDVELCKRVVEVCAPYKKTKTKRLASDHPHVDCV